MALHLTKWFFSTSLLFLNILTNEKAKAQQDNFSRESIKLKLFSLIVQRNHNDSILNDSVLIYLYFLNNKNDSQCD